MGKQFFFIAVSILLQFNMLQTQAKDSYKAEEFKLPDQYKNRTIPAKVDNRGKYLRLPFEHLGHPCGFAASLSYTYCYEMNFARDVSATDTNNLYPYTYGYHFHNEGKSTAMCMEFPDGYKLAMATGIPNNTAMGGFTSGFPTKWLNGYDKYYQAMKGRCVEYKYFDCKTTQGISDLKQYVYDHANGTKGGGLANFNVISSSNQTTKITSGVEVGKTLITSFGKGSSFDHTLTIIGYDDNVAYDFNGDGRITGDVDITRDGVVDMQDSEQGAFLIINSHIYWDAGYAFAAYKLFSTAISQGGIGRNNQVWCMKVNPDYPIKYALKTTITCASRDKIKIYAGIAPTANATQPTKTKGFAGAFNYAGGAFPLEGQNLKSTIEIGLDVTDLIDSIGGTVGAFFLCIDTKTGGTGKVNKLSLMDYTGGGTPKEYPYKDTAVAFSSSTKLGGIMPQTSSISNDLQKANSFLRISPNPVMKGKDISFSIPESNFSSAQIGLFNLEGSLVLQQRLYKANTGKVNLSTESLAAGVYKMRVLVERPDAVRKRYDAMITIVK